jgi:hypothetical protein
VGRDYGFSVRFQAPPVHLSSVSGRTNFQFALATSDALGKLRKLVPFRRFVAAEPVNCGTTPADLHETFYHLSICMANGRYRRANDTVPSWSSAPLRKVPESQIGTCIRRHDRWIILFCGTEVVPRQDRCCTDLWFAGATRTKFVFFSSHL